MAVCETRARFSPPSLPLQVTHNTTHFYTEIPSNISNDPSGEVVLGVDEAGRGPVLGPMVYAAAYCSVHYLDQLKSYGFDDSKALSAEFRLGLLQQMCETADLVENVGWCTTTMSARDIARGMLRPVSHGVYNLNEQAHDATMALIQGVLDRGVNVKRAYIDTVGPPDKYEAKLSRRFPGIKFTVAKKADSLYPIVSAASICAKVTRDASLATMDCSGGKWGSGYPSDSKTSTWLRSQVDPVYGWGNVVRFSWGTCRDALEQGGGVNIEWADDIETETYGVKSLLERVPVQPQQLESLAVSTLWYGSGVRDFDD
ncbi:hypothetical protein NADFUDRAFT_49556 [Nadsonia fulvescens var. elongata DSM 6958]|uniref:Ribonuclease n=1 Tax=Nadsonia fulvescens var. elongata DSM 6958 TaxID=857566 RepID=A0A1E3PNV6_9ASCO|nr:hypothetical protein NADFUDRAFT_49556 [Nadsonia fulvescens var. elongata DSM 6958]